MGIWIIKRVPRSLIQLIPEGWFFAGWFFAVRSFPGTQRVRRCLKLPCFPCSGQIQYFLSHPSCSQHGVLPQRPANLGLALRLSSLLNGLLQAGWGGRRPRRGKTGRHLLSSCRCQECLKCLFHIAS